MNSIAERILLVRGKITQKEFAERLKINANTLRSYENGRALPNNVFLEKVCTLFSINPSWLLLGTGSMRTEDKDIKSEKKSIESKGALTLEEMHAIIKKLEEKLAETKEAERAALIEAKEAYKLAFQSTHLHSKTIEMLPNDVETSLQK